MQADRFQVKDFPAIDSVSLDRTGHKVRVYIATEEIIRPVRNGGIASTYCHLCKGLVALGHDIHVLFLKGPVVQDETPEYWQRHFAEFGVTLHYLEMPPRAMMRVRKPRAANGVAILHMAGAALGLRIQHLPRPGKHGD